MQAVDVANVNREEDTVEARSVEAALSALAVGETTPEDRHPERYAHRRGRQRLLISSY